MDRSLGWRNKKEWPLKGGSIMGEAKNIGVEVCGQPGFWNFIIKGLLEEHVHSGVALEGRRTERPEGVILEKRR